MIEKPIDKTKKSNRRCVNCEHYPSDKTVYIETKCKETGRQINYWNCCKLFCWSTRKPYAEPPKEVSE